MSWKEKKQMENRNVVTLGGKVKTIFFTAALRPYPTSYSNRIQPGPPKFLYSFS